MRETLLMDKGWKFYEGDVEDCVQHGYMYTYMHTKTERGKGPASIDFDDREWEDVCIPHDYVVLGRPTPEANPVHGSLVRNQAWYRRTFRLEPGDRKRQISLIFEGICSKSTIWVNGCYMEYNDSAYTEIEVNISDIARYGDDLNTVAVYVDNTDYEGWWYEGGGIYRHVWLVKTAEIAVEHCGIWVHPEKTEGSLWKVPVECRIWNASYENAQVQVTQAIYDMSDEPVWEGKTELVVPARMSGVAVQEGMAKDPALWSVDTPDLYKLKTSVFRKGELLDQVETIFGFRSICFDPDRGFLLNGIPTKIKGMCIHEDHGGLGVALPDRIKEYRVKRLKDMGCNGYRFSHNPHSRETLDACDRLGMLVMDENRWFESSRPGLKRVRNMVKRDRNHPSVIIWSVGNEESLQSGERGKRIMAALHDCIHKLDDTRPVLMAMHTGLLEDGAAETADMIGMNYNIDLCEQVHQRYPDKAIIFSEANNASEEDVLGDSEAGIRTWQIVKEKPYMCGLFAWTGMDYRGEHDYPGLFAPCGCMDQNGYAKKCFSLYQSWWKESKAASGGAECSTKRPAKLSLELENPDVTSGNGDVAILTLRAKDAEGVWIPEADCAFRIVSLKGGKLLVTGNGDVKDQSDRRSREGRLYQGIAQILVEVTEEELEIAVTSENDIEPVIRQYQCQKGKAVPMADAMTSRYITKWEMADWVLEKPEKRVEAYQNMKGFKSVEIGHGTQMHDLYKDSGFLVYHSQSMLPAEMVCPLAVQFELLEGKADIMICLQDAAGTVLQTVEKEKQHEEPDELMVELPMDPRCTAAEIWVCLEIFMPFCGITKPVRWEFKE